jgi:hypothetical protein
MSVSIVQSQICIHVTDLALNRGYFLQALEVSALFSGWRLKCFYIGNSL